MAGGVLEQLMIKIGANSKDAEREVKGFRGFVEREMEKVQQAGAMAAAGFAAEFVEGVGQEANSDLMAAQLDLTETESARAGAVAGDLFSNAYGESFGEVNEALRGVIAQTGELGDVTDAELSAMGANVLDLARVIGTDVTRITQVAGQAVRHGLAEDMDEAFDLISSASANTMPGLQDDVLDAADEYGRFFADIGLDGEQAFGILATASQDGMFGIDKAGDAVAEFTKRSIDMSATTTEAFSMIGLDANQMANDLLAGGDTAATAFSTIVGGLLDIEDPADRANAAIALFGTPLEDLGVDEIPTFLSSLTDTGAGLDNVADHADRTGDILNDNTSTAMTTLARTVREEALAAITPFLPMLMGLVQLLMPLAPVLIAIAGALVIAAAAIKAWTIIVQIAKAAQMLWNAAMLANPITWLVLLIVALIAIVVLLVVHWDEVTAALGAAWDWLKRKATELVTWIITGFQSMVAGVKTAVSAAKEWVVEKFLAIVSFVSSLPGKISSAASGMWDGIKDAFKSALNWLIGKWNGLSFTVPSIDMGPLGSVGGFTISVPSIPMLAKGGDILGGGAAMVGEAGPEILDLPRGARVSPLDRAGGGRQDIYLHLDGDEDLIRMFRRGIKARGGDVQVVLGN